MTKQKTASLQALQSTIAIGVMILLVGIMCISCSSAQQFVFKQGSAVDLKINCLDNNQSFCSADTLCNITINYPNGTNAVTNGVMTRNAAFFNYTLSSAKNSALGEHYATVLCSGLTNGASTFTFEITHNGFQQSTSQGINSAFYLFLMLALTTLMGVLGFKLAESKYLGFLGILFIFLMYLLIVYDFYLGYEFHINLTGINDGSGMQATIFYIFMFILVAGLIVSALLLFRHWKKIKQMYKRAIADEKRDDEEDTREWNKD